MRYLTPSYLKLIKERSPHITLLIGALLVLVLSACKGYSRGPLVQDPFSEEVSPKFKAARVQTIAVLPLESGAVNRIESQTLQELTQLLVDTLSAQTSFDVLNESSPEAVKKATAEAVILQEPSRFKAVALGKRLNSDAVLFGVVNRYRESSGGALGSNQPAAVSFRLWLVSSKTKEQLWSAVFEKQEQPLSNNLFALPQALRSGVRYESSSELIKSGFSKVGAALEELHRTSP